MLAAPGPDGAWAGPVRGTGGGSGPGRAVRSERAARYDRAHDAEPPADSVRLGRRLGIVVAGRSPALKPRSRRLLPTTKTEEKAMAAPAIIGLRSPAAASGRAATL